jgi:selenocysteine-specific translation elongation factor
MLERVQKRVDASPLTESDKRAFMKGLSITYGNSKVLADRRQVMAAEVQWSGATVGLYQFALANSARIKVKGSQIVIDDEKLRTRFSQQLEESMRLKGNVEKLNAQFEQDRRDSAQEIGLTPKDIEADNEKVKPK